MALRFNPAKGSICICDFRNSIYPEISKKRPVVVINSISSGLSIVVPCSTTAPDPEKPWHYKLQLDKALPPPYTSLLQWVKCDLIMAVSHQRLQFPFIGRDLHGKRIYDQRILKREDFNNILNCIAMALALKGSNVLIDNNCF